MSISAYGVAVDATGVYVAGAVVSGLQPERWRVEKRSPSGGSLIWRKTRNYNSPVLDVATDVVVDNTGAYIVGNIDNNSRWRIEKRKLSNGGLIWKRRNSGGNFRGALSVTTDASNAYVVGSGFGPLNEWRIEKRRPSSGSLLKKWQVPVSLGQQTRAVATDATGIYIAGMRNGRWRIEKREKVSPPPTVSLQASPAASVVGAASALSWSTTGAVDACTASGDWSGAKAQSGSESTGTFAAAQTYTYTLDCTGPGGSGSDSASVSVGPAPQIISFAVSPDPAYSGVSVSTLWSSTGMDSCTASGLPPWSGVKPANGSENIGPIASDAVLDLQCTNATFGITDTAQVTVTYAYCGDGTAQTAYEQCDRSDLDGNDCTTVGSYTGGSLDCDASCNFDTSSCVTECGDGIDNEPDGLTDKDDPGCWSDPNDPSSYDPALPSEDNCGNNICESLTNETPASCPVDCDPTFREF